MTDKMREEFEAWVLSEYPNQRMSKFSDGEYHSTTIQYCWLAWQAARLPDAKDLLGHNDHLVELLEARGRLMLAVEIERDQLKAENEALRLALESCADELEGQVIQCYHGQPVEDMHPVVRRSYDRDMLCVTEARAAMGKGEQS
jgi:hypothetical protein